MTHKRLSWEQLCRNRYYDQKRWIEQHGGCLATYVARYYELDDPHRGARIYKADVAELRKAREALATAKGEDKLPPDAERSWNARINAERDAYRAALAQLSSHLDDIRDLTGTDRQGEFIEKARTVVDVVLFPDIVQPPHTHKCRDCGRETVQKCFKVTCKPENIVTEDENAVYEQCRACLDAVRA